MGNRNLDALRARKVNKVRSKINTVENMQKIVEQSSQQGGNMPLSTAPIPTAIKAGISEMKGIAPRIVDDLDYPEWGSLMGVYESLAEHILGYAEAVNENWKTVEAAGRADSTFVGIVKTVIRDCSAIGDRLVANKNRHADKVGKTNINDLDIYYEIGDVYNAIIDEFRQLSLQATTEITYYLTDVVNLVDKSQNVENLMNQVLADAAKSVITTPEPTQDTEQK